MHTFHKRILKEFKRLQKNPLPGITIKPSETDPNDLSVFVFDITLPPDSDGVLHSIYRSDIYQLRIKITDDYPVDSPEVQFLNSHPGSKIPLHPHIYSNGHICLDLLGSGWTPACSMESILLSIQSMLSTNELAERPPDDQAYVRTAPLNPKKTTFDYHDDNV
ncbi:ubiquitin-conjugating enzyme E2 13 [[Candida] railenensis]|uniref:Ubiquitin-conjugating enzyme E2 13 n=1 Tax=[Candida] railenensis TaxID=45579 RepID=A0A9P0VZQ9_9ASCO|nr:ubiquitin-conjugating enzyme E2 13 [[Candida] railenensis]